MFFFDYTYESSEKVFSFLLIMIPRENEMLTGIHVAFGQNQAPESEINRVRQSIDACWADNSGYLEK